MEEHPETKCNGYYNRDLQLPFGQLEDLRVLQSRDGGFKSQLLPHHRRSVEETQELIRALLMAGVPTRKIGEALKQLYGMQLSHTTASRLARVAQAEITAWREILQELQQQGVEDVEFIVADGLAGLKKVIAKVFPQERYHRY